MPIDGLAALMVAGLLGGVLFLGVVLLLIFAGIKRQTELFRRPAVFHLVGMATSSGFASGTISREFS